MNDLHLTSLLCARLCHELVSPVAAINNGLELLDDDPDFRDEAMKLLSHSSAEVARRLQFMRSAYGTDSGSVADQSLAEALNLAEAYFSDGKYTLEGPSGGFEDTSKEYARLALNLILCVSEALPRGGRIEVGTTQSLDRAGLIVRGHGTVVKADEEFRRCLADEMNPLDADARTVQPLFTARLAASLRGTVRLATNGENALELAFLPNRNE